MPEKGINVKLKIIAYQPETFISMGTVGLNTKIKVTGKGVNKVKRIIAAMISVALVGCIQLMAAAETGKIETPGQSVSIEVKAVYVESSETGVYKGEVKEGSSSIKTENGVNVAVSGDKETFDDGVMLVVKEITEEETGAFSWFSEVLKEVGTNILPLDIYFEKNGQKVQVNSRVRVTITLPEGYINPVVCYVSTDGQVEILQCTVEDGKITFEVEHFSYYVLADRKDAGGTTEPTTSTTATDTTKPDTTTTGTTVTTKKGDAPKTGEAATVFPYLLLTAPLFAAMYVSFANKQRLE